MECRMPGRWKRRLYTLTGIFLLLMLVLKNVSKQHHQGLVQEKAYFENVDKKFKDFSSKMTRTFHMVCLENKPRQKIRFQSSHPKWYSKNKEYLLPYMRSCGHVYPQKDITVYDDASHRSYSPNVSSKLALILGFKLKFKPRHQLPDSFTIIENETAYFLGYHKYFEPTNFFHFTRQIYFPLYWLIKSTGQLYRDAQNILFYPGPYAMCTAWFEYVSHDINRFRYFRDILHVKNKLELSAYTDRDQPDKVCYRNAVFSSQMFLSVAKEAIAYFKSSTGVRDKCKPNVLTIINRHSYRRILNTEQLKQIGDLLGYETQVLEMEKLTLKEQAQAIHCTKILVGVTGAGLQWAYFMKDFSGVVEIAWPHHDWPFFFTSKSEKRSHEMNVIRPLKLVRLSKVKCILNPGAVSIYYKEIFYKNRTFSPKESLAILKDKRNYVHKTRAVTSVGKLCDITVDLGAFQEAILSAGKG